MKIFKKCKKILRDRNKQYGNSNNMFYTTFRLWNGYLLHKNKTSVISPLDIPILMALHKIAREANEHKEDNLIDAINYLALANEMYGKDKA